VFPVCSSRRLVPCVTTAAVAVCVELSSWVFPVCYSTQTATVAVVTQGTSRGEEQPGNTHNDNSTQGATAKIGVNGSNPHDDWFPVLLLQLLLFV
jgi:hypothetical protein